MRDLFPGHYRLPEEKIKELWENAIFIFDSNVLLNLYSYPEQARNDFFSVLNKIKKDIWIPYQVAFEFHKNRFNRIRTSNDAVEKLQTKLKRAHKDLAEDFEKIEFSKRNTGVNDLTDRITAAENAYKQLESAIDLACARLPKISLDDPIGKEIADLFIGKVGVRPKDQEEIDSLISDGEKRYHNEIPPGFMDKAKGESHIDGDTIYPAKFGDLIIWKQAINHIKETKKLNVIFITGDRKEDWWWSEKGEIIGPHPRLISEFLTKSEAEKFWIYTSDKFLEYANTFLKGIKISKDSIEQVKHASDHQQSFDEVQVRTNVSYEALQQKLKNIRLRLANGEYESPKIPDFGPTENGNEIAINLWIKTLYPNSKVLKTEEVDYLVIDGRDAIAAIEIMQSYNLSARSISKKIIDLGAMSEAEKILVVLIESTNVSEFKKFTMEDFAVIKRTMIMSSVDKVVFGYIVENTFIPMKKLPNI